MSLIHGFAESFSHAWRGLLLAFRTERSFRIHIAASIVVLLACMLFPLAAWERAVLLLATASVLVLELLNSMVERLTDLVKPRIHAYAHDIKDLMAAAVLIASSFAAALGFFILIPHLGAFLDRI
ncbi:MAG: diacylglycerol kinase family protein [Patescibacteria group bacterium]